MLHQSVMPMRATVGKPLPIVSVRIANRSTETNDFGITWRVHTDLNDIAEDPVYPAFLPDSLLFGSPPATFTPRTGMSSMPLPVDLPFHPSAGFAALFCVGTRVQEDISRRLWVDIEVELDPGNELPLGGIVYGGHPFVPYYITSRGENSANFGLPREIRISWPGRLQEFEEGQFLDAESALVNEEPTSHSGVHILATGPIVTNRFTLRLSGFPRFVRKTQPQASGVGMEEMWGFAIPFLFAFAYEEGTRYRPRVPAGLLAAVQVPPNLEHSYFSVPDPASAALFPGPCADFVARNPPGFQFYANSAASMFGQRRTFTVGTSLVEECFASGPLNPGDEVRIYVEQAEENDRCLSGFRIRYPGWMFEQATRETLLAKLAVYELDPVEGVSPVQVGLDPRKDKYAKCIFEDDKMLPDPLQAYLCRFRRPTSCRYLALVFTCLAPGGKRLIIQNLDLMQSAHVTVTPRPSRTQQIGSMHYRIVAPQLGDDYARLGSDGFSFSVERLSAGERKEVLFSANSLLDLVQSGNARMLTNNRYEETEVDVSTEDAVTLKGHDQRTSRTRTTGWRLNQTGVGVAWDRDDDGNLALPQDQQLPVDSTPDTRGFQAYGNTEIRTHGKQLGVQGGGDDNVARKLITGPQGINQLLAASGAEGIFLDDHLLRDYIWDATVWQGSSLEGDPMVDGLLNLSFPPWMAFMDGVNTLAALVEGLGRELPTGPTPVTQEQIQEALSTSPLGILNGLNIGVGFNYDVVSGNVSMGQLAPLVNRSFSTGTTGTIVRQGSLTGHSYSQSKNSGYDGASVYTDYLGGQIYRGITRTLNLPGTLKNRRAAVEIYWQGRAVDIVTGSIGVNILLPATSGKIYRATDDSLCVRFPNGIPPDIEMDVWFEIDEEIVRDDY